MLEICISIYNIYILLQSLGTVFNVCQVKFINYMIHIFYISIDIISAQRIVLKSPAKVILLCIF